MFSRSEVFLVPYWVLNPELIAMGYNVMTLLVAVSPDLAPLNALCLPLFFWLLRTRLVCSKFEDIFDVDVMWGILYRRCGTNRAQGEGTTRPAP